MTHRWLLPLAAAVALAACTPDRTLETLVPADAIAVALVDHPNLVAAALGGAPADLPWAALDANRPWAAAVVPASPPGFRLFVAVGNAPDAWKTVQTWARDRGGLEVRRAGGYAVLSSPGLPAYETGGYDLQKVRADGDPLAAYVDLGRLPRELLQGAAGSAPALGQMQGIRVGLNGRDGGVEVRAVVVWKPGSPWADQMKAAPHPDLAPWARPLPAAGGLSLVAVADPSAWAGAGMAITDPALRQRLGGLTSLLGDRWSMVVSPKADGSVEGELSWATADPQGVRQGLKSLVASGDLQRQAAAWGLDPDTPFTYQDRRDGLGGEATKLTVGPTAFGLAWGDDRLALAWGREIDAALRVNRRAPETPADWATRLPEGTLAAAVGSWDGLKGRLTLLARPNGDAEVRATIDAADLNAWETRLPQALVHWVSGEGGWTRFEP